MLPDYPSIKKKIQRNFEESLKKEIQKDPLLSQIKIRRVHEGNILTSISTDGFTDTREYELLKKHFEIDKEKVIHQGPDAYFSKISEIAKGMANQQSQLFFKKMDEVTERTGNVVQAKSKPLSPQLILEALEKVAISFDDFGNPIFPNLYLHPDQYNKIKDEIPKWESDIELQKKHKELVERKWSEYIDRENNRKLVD